MSFKVWTFHVAVRLSCALKPKSVWNQFKMAVDDADDDEAVKAASHAAMQAYAHTHSSPDRSKAIKIGKVGLTKLCISFHKYFVTTIIDASHYGLQGLLWYTQTKSDTSKLTLSQHTNLMPLSWAVKPACTSQCALIDRLCADRWFSNDW